MSEWIDVTVPLQAGMAGWPGDQPFLHHREAEMAKGSEYNLSRLHSSVHAGTHMDAPLHFIHGGASIDSIPLAVAMGRARVIGIEHPEEICLAEVERAGIQAGERILFRTRNSDHRWWTEPFKEDFVGIPEDAAEFLAERKPALVGVDYLSVAPFAAPGPTHRLILGAGIWVVEGLDLTRTAPGEYELICLPMKLAGAEGAPARVVLRPV